jgi:DNA-binding MltR family transcriptional regulator
MEVKNMLSPLVINEFENDILELIDDQDKYTRSDLQGVVTVLVNKIMEMGYQIFKDQEKSK